MKKLFAMILTVALLVCGISALAEEAESDALEVNCLIDEGAFVIQIPVEDGDMSWVADDMAQDDSVVSLYYSDVLEDTFVARYEPTGDGDVTVGVRHYYNAFACDEAMTWDLHVEDGEVKEVTGGSHTASPAEEDQDPYLSGEWLEQDTQFTTLNATWNAEGGWDIEIVSPLSHGAWLIRARAYYDCDYGAFVYDNGVMYNLIPEEGEPEEKAAEGLWGSCSRERKRFRSCCGTAGKTPKRKGSPSSGNRRRKEERKGRPLFSRNGHSSPFFRIKRPGRNAGGGFHLLQHPLRVLSAEKHRGIIIMVCLAGNRDGVKVQNHAGRLAFPEA